MLCLCACVLEDYDCMCVKLYCVCMCISRDEFFCEGMCFGLFRFLLFVFVCGYTSVIV